MKINQLKQISLNEFLINAARNGNLDKVKEALKNGADIHYQNDLALIFASKNGHLEVVKYLVKNGSFVGNKSIPDRVLNTAAENGHLEVIKYLVKNVDFVDHSVFLNAISSRNTKLVDFLSTKVDIFYTSIGGRRQRLIDEALDKACLINDLKMLKLLIEKGADIYHDFDRVLKTAIDYSHQEIIEFLISEMDPKHVIKNYPKYIKFIKNQSNISLFSKFSENFLYLFK